jgi:hypothetical protein
MLNIAGKSPVDRAKVNARITPTTTMVAAAAAATTIMDEEVADKDEDAEAAE